MKEGKPARLRLVHVTTVPMTLRFLTGQAAYLRQEGFEISAISSPGEGLEEFQASEGVECHAVPMERRISPLHDVLALARLVRLLRRVRPDIVDAHTPKAGLLGVTAARLAGVPVRVYHLHGLRFLTVRGPRRLLLVAAEKLAAALSTRVLCVSHSYAELATACALAPASKVGVLLSGSINGVDSDRFRPATPAERRAARESLGIPERSRVIGFVGRLVRDKGLVELAAAWQRLRDEMPDLRLVLVGPFESGDPIPQSVAAQLLADPRVRLTGLDWDSPKYYRAFDVVAFPTYREGLGMVSLEAAATALPIVASRVLGCMDAVVDGVTGTLVPARDEGALAEALRAYLEDPALRERHGAAARERVLRVFQRERIWRALRDEYRALASKAAGGAPRPSVPAPAAATGPRPAKPEPKAGARATGVDSERRAAT